MRQAVSYETIRLVLSDHTRPVSTPRFCRMLEKTGASGEFSDRISVTGHNYLAFAAGRGFFQISIGTAFACTAPGVLRPSAMYFSNSNVSRVTSSGF
jgi:hypothetical protein